MEMTKNAQTNEKRYFCDYFLKESTSIRSFSTAILISFFVITFIGGIFSYNHMLVKYENELNTYSEVAYIYLDEIASKTVKEGVGIDLLALPDDVAKYEITGGNDKIELKYYLDNNKGLEYADSANMTIELNYNFTIISKTPNYLSEEEYIKDMKNEMLVNSIWYCMIGWVICMGVILIGCMIICIISSFNKWKDNHIKSANSDENGK